MDSFDDFDTWNPSSYTVSFNSIEWIQCHTRAELKFGTPIAFNSIEWILQDAVEYYKRAFLSIPLNGFLVSWTVPEGKVGFIYFQFH
jgi:hypothetical protein